MDIINTLAGQIQDLASRIARSEAGELAQLIAAFLEKHAIGSAHVVRGYTKHGFDMAHLHIPPGGAHEETVACILHASIFDQFNEQLDLFLQQWIAMRANELVAHYSTHAARLVTSDMLEDFVNALPPGAGVARPRVESVCDQVREADSRNE